MEEKSNIIKEQYNVEKENERIIESIVEETMENATDTKFLIDFTQQIRAYRNELYELKKNLGDTITEAYEVKNNRIMSGLKKSLEAEIIRIDNRRVPKGTDELSEFRYIDELKNISRSSTVFEYYERQIAFWQEMNLKKAREESTQEYYFE